MTKTLAQTVVSVGGYAIFVKRSYIVHQIPVTADYTDVVDAACGVKASRAGGWIGTEQFDAARINGTVEKACPKCAKKSPIITVTFA